MTAPASPRDGGIGENDAVAVDSGLSLQRGDGGRRRVVGQGVGRNRAGGQGVEKRRAGPSRPPAGWCSPLAEAIPASVVRPTVATLKERA